MSKPGEGLRFQLLLDGEVHLEEWFDTPEDIGDAPGRHAQIALKHPDKEWMIEIFDPEAPEDQAYIRFGSSPTGMIAPIRLNP